MITYYILQYPGHNRVYFLAADKLAEAELIVATKHFDTPCNEVKHCEIKGEKYLSLTTENELTDNDILILSRLSFTYVVFKGQEINGELYLLPVQKNDYEYLDSKIRTILKYPGKTNELFTQMMINVALHSGKFSVTDKISLLDPVAGRGTTLFEAAVFGFDCAGVEIDSKSVHDAVVFYKKFMEAERWKYKLEKRQVSGKKRSDAVFADEFEYAPGKNEFKDKENRKKLSLITGDAHDVASYFKKESFHLIVGDLPYGIAHGINKGKPKKTAVIRNPSELLSECVSQWYKILKKGGTIVLAWNTYVVNRLEIGTIFLDNGFHVFTETPYNNFEHQVDKSIKRDIIVAGKW